MTKGDRVAVSLGNNIEYAIVGRPCFYGVHKLLISVKATYGLFKIGAILVITELPSDITTNIAAYMTSRLMRYRYP